MIVFPSVTPAVVLAARPTRESDIVVVLMTAQHGKIAVHARAARNSRRRFPGGLSVGARGEATLARGRGLPSLSDFSPVADNGAIARDLDGFAQVAYLCELTDHLVVGADPDTELFAALCTAIGSAIDRPHASGLRRYELTLLRCLGLLPALERCAICGSARPEGEVPFDAGHGGVLCALHGARAALRVHSPALDLATGLLANGTWPDDVELDARRGLRDLCRDALSGHLRGPLRSVGFFGQIARGIRRDAW